MKNIMQIVQEKPYISIILLTLLGCASFYFARGLDIDTSERSLIIENDPELAYYDETIEKFASDNMEMIYIEDSNIFSYNSLTKIEEMIFELEEIEGVFSVESLFSATNFKSEDDFLNLDPFIDYIPEEQTEIETIKTDALNNPIVVGSLVSKSGRHMIIRLFFDDERSRDNKLFDVEMVNKIEKVLEKYRGDFDRLFQTGNPFIKKTLFDTIKHDRQILFPLSIIILLIMLVLTVRSLHGAVLPLLTSLTSIGATIAFMNVVKIPLNILTFIIPSLIIVIGSTEDTHIICEYFEGLKLLQDRKKAIDYLSKKVGTAILITSITTFLGFFFISINKITVLRQFGIAAAFGMFINPLITVLLSPVYLRFFGPKKYKKRRENFFHKAIDTISRKIALFVISRKKLIILVFIGFTGVISLFIPRIELEYDLIQNFEKKAPVRQNIDLFQENVSGINTFFLRVKSPEEGAFSRPKLLKKIDELQKELTALEGIDKVTGITDYLKLMNREMNYGNPDMFVVPASEELIYQYYLMLDPYETRSFITSGYDEVNLIITHTIASSVKLDTLLEKVNKLAVTYTGEIGSYRLTGFQLLTKESSTSIAIGTVQGVLILSVIIFILMSLLFVNIKAGFISLLSNSLPVLFSFGLMGLFKIPLNTGTCMVAIIALGLAVDDTIHLMARFKVEIQQLQDTAKGVTSCIKKEISPVSATTISLAMLFFVLMVSDLVNIKSFGLLSGLVIIFAFFCDIFFTTALLSNTQFITIFDLLTLKVKQEIVDSKLLTGLKLHQVKELILRGVVREGKIGDYIIKANDIGNNIHIILDGEVEVSLYDEEKKRRVVFITLGAGDVMGELAVLMPVKRTADVIVTKEVRYFEINRDGLKRLERFSPRIAARVYNNISVILGERMLKLNRKYLKDVD